MAKQRNPNESLLTIKEVLELLPVGKSAFYAGIKTGLYPEPIKFGVRISRWKRCDIEDIAANGVLEYKPYSNGRPSARRRRAIYLSSCVVDPEFDA